MATTQELTIAEVEDRFGRTAAKSGDYQLALLYELLLELRKRNALMVVPAPVVNVPAPVVTVNVPPAPRCWLCRLLRH